MLPTYDTCRAIWLHERALYFTLVTQTLEFFRAGAQGKSKYSSIYLHTVCMAPFATCRAVFFVQSSSLPFWSRLHLPIVVSWPVNPNTSRIWFLDGLFWSSGAYGTLHTYIHTSFWRRAHTISTGCHDHILCVQYLWPYRAQLIRMHYTDAGICVCSRYYTSFSWGSQSIPLYNSHSSYFLHSVC